MVEKDVIVPQSVDRRGLDRDCFFEVEIEIPRYHIQTDKENIRIFFGCLRMSVKDPPAGYRIDKLFFVCH
jgi:hypothetical protein